MASIEEYKIIMQNAMDSIIKDAEEMPKDYQDGVKRAAHAALNITYNIDIGVK